MWKRRLAWGSLTFVLFFVFTLVIGIRENLKPAGAAVLVNDTPNTLQNTTTAINTATTAINTATQVANQVKNLASMSPEGLLAQYLGVSAELGQVVGVWQAYNGLMTATQTMDQSWNNAFQQVNTFFSGGTSTIAQRNSNNQSTLQALESTYRDSMNTASAMTNTTTATQNLQTSLTNVANAVGNKQVVQANSQIASAAVKEQIKTNAQLGQLLTIEAAKGEAEVNEKAQALADNLNSTVNFSANVAADNAALSSNILSAADQAYPASLAAAYN